MTVVCKICGYIEKYSKNDNNMLLSLYCYFDLKVGRYANISKLSPPKQIGGDNLNTDSTFTEYKSQKVSYICIVVFLSINKRYNKSC